MGVMGCLLLVQSESCWKAVGKSGRCHSRGREIDMSLSHDFCSFGPIRKVDMIKCCFSAVLGLVCLFECVTCFFMKQFWQFWKAL
jgi:hypothetical protein